MSEHPVILTVVCTANICRSPMAAGLLSHALKGEANAPPHEIESAGIAARAGDPPSENSQTAMKKAGIDISGHRSQGITPELLARSDAVFCMTADHARMMETLFPGQSRTVRLFREFAPTGNAEVPDPYGGSLDEYIQCRDSLVEAIPGLLRFLFQEVFPGRDRETR